MIAVRAFFVGAFHSQVERLCGLPLPPPAEADGEAAQQRPDDEGARFGDGSNLGRELQCFRVAVDRGIIGDPVVIQITERVDVTPKPSSAPAEMGALKPTLTSPGVPVSPGTGLVPTEYPGKMLYFSGWATPLIEKAANAPVKFTPTFAEDIQGLPNCLHCSKGRRRRCYS